MSGMKRSKRVLVALLAAGMSLAMFTGGNPGKVQAAPKENPVLLKINDYYVLYTAPKAPYVDANYRTMIPLRSISELMGAKVGYDAKAKTATIQKDDVKVIFTIGSKNVSVNGVAGSMDTVPVMEQNSMFIPVSVLAGRLGITNKWDQANRLYTLTGESLMQTDMIKYTLEDMEGGPFTAPPGKIISNDAFRPVSYTYDSGKGSFTVKSKNITGKDIPAGAADVAAYILYDDTLQFPPQERQRPAVRKEGTLEVTVKTETPKAPAYLLVKGRLLDGSGK
ncbi:copper amine oxidase N-terminal domain-containing protein [Paenibacillus tritici]|uniref:copper amine oxidase N-terminal domain-containing protein n=1 Tax=Paenibacillus tritici TaxID=1873425 RepID=UPI001BA9A2C9|nr:copper amine oxidase N-terminal domain-containing protein [Paenibacillus tritici]QUL57292.1 copper amine oxidase N-terminal domain-containing protein [Paenibacillus tritici]